MPLRLRPLGRRGGCGGELCGLPCLLHTRRCGWGGRWADPGLEELGTVGENPMSQSLIGMPSGLVLSISVEAWVTELWTVKLCDCQINLHASKHKHAKIPIVLLVHVNNFTVMQICAHHSIMDKNPLKHKLLLAIWEVEQSDTTDD